VESVVTAFVGVKMRPELRERLRVAARRQGDTSVSAVIRRLCADGLTRDEQTGM
jgi:hypothetical protein